VTRGRQTGDEAMIASLVKFEIGNTYSTRSSCDWDTIFSYTVIARTAKTITIEDKHGHVSKRGVKADYDGVAEACYPEGRYSMCPVIKADRELS
jgi:hypothetical protein